MHLYCIVLMQWSCVFKALVEDSPPKMQTNYLKALKSPVNTAFKARQAQQQRLQGRATAQQGGDTAEQSRANKRSRLSPGSWAGNTTGPEILSTGGVETGGGGGGGHVPLCRWASTALLNLDALVVYVDAQFIVTCRIH